jgi:hypothetical protein
MTIKTFKIELRADVTQEGGEAITEIVRQHAIDLKVMVMLINDNRYRAQVAVTAEDSFYNVEEISLDG